MRKKEEPVAGIQKYEYFTLIQPFPLFPGGHIITPFCKIGPELVLSSNFNCYQLFKLLLKSIMPKSSSKNCRQK